MASTLAGSLRDGEPLFAKPPRIIQSWFRTLGDTPIVSSFPFLVLQKPLKCCLSQHTPGILRYDISYARSYRFDFFLWHSRNTTASRSFTHFLFFICRHLFLVVFSTSNAVSIFFLLTDGKTKHTNGPSFRTPSSTQQPRMSSQNL